MKEGLFSDLLIPRGLGEIDENTGLSPSFGEKKVLQPLEMCWFTSLKDTVRMCFLPGCSTELCCAVLCCAIPAGCQAMLPRWAPAGGWSLAGALLYVLSFWFPIALKYQSSCQSTPSSQPCCLCRWEITAQTRCAAAGLLCSPCLPLCCLRVHPNIDAMPSTFSYLHHWVLSSMNPTSKSFSQQ